MSGHIWPDFGQNRLTLTKCGPNLGEIGPIAAKLGPMLLKLGLDAPGAEENMDRKDDCTT